MKWFRNKEMLQDILEQNKNELEKYKHDKIVALLKDESNLIQDHLELLEENKKLKKKLDIYQKYTGDYYDEETEKYYITVDCDFGCKGDVITKEEFEVLNNE